jgi:hypothetical protein
MRIGSATKLLYESNVTAKTKNEVRSVFFISFILSFHAGLFTCIIILEFFVIFSSGIANQPPGGNGEISQAELSEEP